MSGGSPPVWLFVSYGGGHVKALLPVALRVQALGLAQPVYLALTTAADSVRAAGLPVLGFRDFLEADDERARRKGEDLAAQLAVQAADPSESIAYLGLSYVDLEDRLGPEAAQEAYRRYGRQALLPLGVLRRVIERVRPALVVATNSPRAERAAIETARAMGVPSACLVDLLGLWERDLLARSDYADAVCVLNEGVRRHLLAAGRPAADVHVTGNPAFDPINGPEVIAAGAALRHAQGWEGLHVLLCATSPEPRSIPGVAGEGDPTLPRRIESALLEAVRANPRLALWVRRHPSETAADEIAALDHPRIRVSARTDPLHACIHASDEVVVTGSTVGVEASIAGKRVTQVRGSILDHLSPYVSLGIADREVAVQDLTAVFAHAGAQGQPARASQATIGDKAVDRVVAVLRALVPTSHG
ncbi:MAG: UDP-glycosyltransferase [Ramlibacter sp.]